jgi:hypothetical protein
VQVGFCYTLGRNKMKNHRLCLFVIATASLVLLTGFKKPDVDTQPSTEKKTTSTETKKVKISKQKKNRHPQLRVNDDAKMQKSLDLSIPLTDAWLKTGQNQRFEPDSSNIFTVEKKKPRPVDLAGQMIMSQEPEADKRKSVDGAAIVINLKR